MNFFYKCSVFKSVSIGAVLVLLSFLSFSQQKPVYNLLWEISGKGLTKPSYLFGSMHLKDRRVFNFSDSVMVALASSSSFAMEVQPDTMINAMVNHILSGKGDFKSPTINDYSRPDDMPTFIDAYLYGIARTMRKEILGLEQIETQMELLESLQGNELFNLSDAELEKEQMEEMIGIYARGNLNEIWVYIKKMDLQIGDIAGRNKVMATKIGELMAKKSLFATVGAAHMPGEDGIIALLIQAGYTLRPVSASFTGIANKYTIDHTKMEWYAYTDAENGYAVSFPSKPFTNGGGTGLKSAAYPDMTNDAIFTSTALYTGPVKNGNTLLYLDSLLEVYLKRDSITLLSKKEDFKDGTKAYDVLMQNKGKYMRTCLLHKNNTFYTLSVENKANTVSAPYAELFFNSFKTNASPLAANSWIKYQNKEGAFSLQMPSEPEYVGKVVEQPERPEHPYELHMYVAVDRNKQATYLVRYNDFPLGIYLEDRSVVLDGLVKEFAAKGTPTGPDRTIFKDGMEGRAIDVVVNGMMMEFRIYLRGNRTYVLLRQNLAAAEVLKNDVYFDSFKLENPIVPEGKISQIGNISVNAPGKLEMVKDAEASEEGDSNSYLWKSKVYVALNKSTGGVYSLEQAEFSPYYRLDHLDSLYARIMKQMISAKDSVYHTNDAMVAQLKAKDFFIRDKISGVSKRSRIWIDGKQLYHQSARVDQQEMESKPLMDFFDKVRITPSGSYDLSTSKAALILKDLASQDSMTYKNAMGAIRYYTFDQSELPAIYAALKLKYTDDTLHRGVRSTLINEFLALKDERTVPVLKALFDDHSNPDPVRAKVLSTITDVDSLSYDWYLKNLINGKPLQIEYPRPIFMPLRDSLELASANMDGLFRLLDEPVYRQQVLYVFGDMLKKQNREKYLPVFESRMDSWKSRVVKDMDQALLKTNDLENLDFDLIYSYLDIMPALKLTTLTDHYTQKLFKVDTITHLHTSALAARILLKLQLDPKLLEIKLDSLETRWEIMNAFHDAGRLSEVPLKYRKHDEFAKLCMYGYLVDDADVPEDLSLLGELKQGAKTYYVFEFSYLDDDDVKKTYIGVCGGFDERKDQLDFDAYECHTEYDLKTDDWLKQAKALIAE